MKKIIIIIFALITVVGACKKYEEGPCISFRSFEKRLFGFHSITGYYVNGQDSLQLLVDSLGDLCYINRESGSSTSYFTMNGIRTDGRDSRFGSWCGASEKNTNLVLFEPAGEIGTGPFNNSSKNIYFTILRLTKDELKLKTNYNNKEYLIEMK